MRKMGNVCLRWQVTVSKVSYEHESKKGPFHLMLLHALAKMTGLEKMGVAVGSSSCTGQA